MRQPNFHPRGERPQAGFQKIDKEKRAILWRLTKYVLRQYKYTILLVLVCIVITSFTTLASTLFTRTLIDDYIVPLTRMNDPQYKSLAQALFKLGAVLLIGVVCSYAYNRLMINVSQGTMLRLRRTVFERMQHLPLNYFDSRSHGDIMSVYTNDVDSLRQMISTALAQVFSSVITITVTFTAMIALSIPLTLVSIVMALVMMLSTTWLGSISRRHFRVQQQSLAQVNGFIEEMVSGQKVVKVFCHERRALDQFEQINEQLRQSACSANRIANIVMPVNGNLSNLAYVLIATVGALIALHPESTFLNMHFSLTLGTLVAFLTLNKSFTQPVTHLSQQLNSVLNASVGAERVFNLMDAQPETDEGTIELTRPQGDVDFSHVNFGYTAGKQVLFDININTSPGQKIAFVGGTGAGKTTVINLINRFYDIQSGTILYDGIPIADITKSSLRRSMALVPQETRLFTASVLDNLRYGRLDATDQDCIRAAQIVGADDFIRRLPRGYHTVLSPDGGNLSQGERQLLAIARAAVANPPVLVLDEATSSVDTRTEQLVQRGMNRLMQGRTTFVIAHRLSTVRDADQIIVLDHGRVIENGTHHQLLGQHGKYRQLCQGNEL